MYINSTVLHVPFMSRTTWEKCKKNYFIYFLQVIKIHGGLEHWVTMHRFTCTKTINSKVKTLGYNEQFPVCYFTHFKPNSV